MIQDSFLINENSKFANKLLRKFTVVDKLGQGAFSQVFRVMDSQSNFFAIKIVDKQLPPAQLERLQLESEILSMLDHGNIVKFYETIESKRKYYFLLEYIEGRPLTQYIENEQLKLNETQIKNIIKQISNAVAYIHSRGIIHRDLKPDNIIVDKKLQIKLIDFGLSYQTTNQTTHENCGTLLYMAPEAIMKKEYFKSIDVWSIGIMQYLLFNHKHPFWHKDTKESYIKKMREPQKVEFSQNMSREAIKFFCKTAAFEPESRITAEQALRHQWITGLSYNSIMTAREMTDAFRKQGDFLNIIKAVCFLKLIQELSPISKIPQQQQQQQKMKRVTSNDKLMVPQKKQLQKTPNRSCLQTRFTVENESFLSQSEVGLYTNRNYAKLTLSRKQDFKLPPIGKSLTNSPSSKSFIHSPSSKTCQVGDIKKSQFRFK